MLVTMATGVESGHLVHLSDTTHTPYNVCICLFQGVHSGRVCDDLAVMRGEARDHCRPADQLSNHMNGKLAPLHSALLLLLQTPNLPEYPSLITLLLTCLFFLMNR